MQFAIASIVSVALNKKALILLNIKAFWITLGSPRNPEYSGELTTHGLIPSTRDCSNQLFTEDFIIKGFEILRIVFLHNQILNKNPAFLSFYKSFNNNCISSIRRNLERENQKPGQMLGSIFIWS